jgi:hypothetical protein
MQWERVPSDSDSFHRFAKDVAVSDGMRAITHRPLPRIAMLHFFAGCGSSSGLSPNRRRRKVRAPAQRVRDAIIMPPAQAAMTKRRRRFAFRSIPSTVTGARRSPQPPRGSRRGLMRELIHDAARQKRNCFAFVAEHSRDRLHTGTRKRLLLR